MILGPEVAGAAPIQRRARGSRAGLSLYFLVLLPVAWLVIYNFLPLVGLVIAFEDFRPRLGILSSPWVGLKNFEFFFLSGDAWRLTRNTIGLNLLFLVVKVLGGAGIAILLYEVKSRAFTRMFQAVMFVPFFISWVAVAYIAYAFLSPSYGILNGILSSVGARPVNWYAESRYWPFILTVVNTWKWIGYHAILFYASLVTINPALVEAASIDGAKMGTIVRAIYLPHLLNVFWVIVLINLGNVFYADIGLFWNVTRNIGTLYPTTQVLDTFVYNSFRVTGNIGMSTAAGLYQSFVGFVVVLLTNALIRKYNSDSAMF
jgi:putative aldouronate transport system permease protein